VHVEIARHDTARTLDECLERPLCCAALDPRLIVHPMLRGGAFLRALDRQQIARAAGAVTYLVRARGVAKYNDEVLAGARIREEGAESGRDLDRRILIVDARRKQRRRIVLED